MGYGILIGVILTVVYDRIISPIIDLKLEQYKYKTCVICTEEKIKADQLTAEFLREYPEYNQNQEEECQTHAIGFRMDDPVDEDYDDFEDDEDE